MNRLLLALMLAAAPVAVAAQEHVVVEGADAISIELEAAHEEELRQGFDLLGAGKPAEAMAKFDAVIAGYEAERGGMTVRCADSLEEATALSVLLMIDSSLDGEVTILGSNWCAALFAKGFVLIDLRRPNEAETFLKRATVMAPLEAHYINELAELYKSRRQWQLSYDTFARALEVADTVAIETSPQVRARALRGMGYNLIELGDLDTAEALMRQSQELDPENPGAQVELDYIASLRAGKN